MDLGLCLEWLRRQANAIDGVESPDNAIMSVMVLTEGWDVRHVTAIVGRRASFAQNHILPEQPLGRGLRHRYPGGVEAYVSVVGTHAWMDFVASNQAEGVVLERTPMGAGTQAKTPLVVEIDQEHEKKDLDALDSELPVLTPASTGHIQTLAIWTQVRWGINAWPLDSLAKKNSGRSSSRTSPPAR